MKRKTLTYIVILATFTVAGALILQFHFLRLSYNSSEKQFRESVTVALREVTWQLLSAAGNTANFDDITPVEIISKSYYFVNVGSPIDFELLKYHLKEELRRHQIFTDYEFAVSNLQTNELEQKTLITIKGDEEISNYSFPEKKDSNGYYFAVHFPDRSPYFQPRMSIWYMFTALLLIIILFFGYTLSVIIRQRQLSQTQKDFINNLTHELKTPISSIALSANIINDEKILKHPDRLFKYAQIIIEQNNRMYKNVEKVLNLALLEKTKLHLNKEKIELNDLLLTVVEYFKQSDPGSKATINLKKIPEPVYISADKFHFTNIILNILENSVKYSERPPLILLEASTNKSDIFLRFTDNGIGISKKYRKKIFKRFYRIPTGNVHNVKGFGLGLDYVKKIVNAHKWEIKVEDNPEGGSIFILKIPEKR